MPPTKAPTGPKTPTPGINLDAPSTAPTASTEPVRAAAPERNVPTLRKPQNTLPTVQAESNAPSEAAVQATAKTARRAWPLALIALLLAALLVVQVSGFLPTLSTVLGRSTGSVADRPQASPEALVAELCKALSGNQLDQALTLYGIQLHSKQDNLKAILEQNKNDWPLNQLPPVNEGLHAQIKSLQLSAQAADQLRALVFGLGMGVDAVKTLPGDTAPKRLAAIEQASNPAHLESFHLLRMDPPKASYAAPLEKDANFKAERGFKELLHRLALFEYNGKTYVAELHLGHYDQGWFIETLYPYFLEQNAKADFKLGDQLYVALEAMSQDDYLKMVEPTQP